jgi:hypothetical protein
VKTELRVTARAASGNGRTTRELQWLNGFRLKGSGLKVSCNASAMPTLHTGVNDRAFRAFLPRS